jgi:hypothetical protein
MNSTKLEEIDPIFLDLEATYPVTQFWKSLKISLNPNLMNPLVENTIKVRLHIYILIMVRIMYPKNVIYLFCIL